MLHRGLLVSVLVLSGCERSPSPAASAPAPGSPSAGSPSPAASAPAPGSPSAGVASSSPRAAPRRIRGDEARKLVDEGAKLVDVRTAAEYAEKHVRGAENIPVDTIADRDLGPKSDPIVLYCHSGRRSANAAATLHARGYTRVYDLGAMTSWDE